ncbi:MAG TPA: serine hydrolase [Burkholderiaceae bacterium]|jgi:hypothetical protein|nr:serine hydrolase [Burkholderiaceae bacterium]
MRSIKIALIAALALALALVVMVALYIAVRGKDLIRVATGSISHSLCAAAFISGLDPDHVYAEEQRPEGGMWLVAWAVRYQVDRALREVRTTVAGAFAARAVYREGMGCMLVHGDEAVAPSFALRATEGKPGLADVSAAGRPSFAEASETGSPSVAPQRGAEAGLRRALDLAFSEPDPAHPRRTKAIVVLHEGKLVAERYASGYGPDTPIWGHSLSKSVTNALIGVLVRKGVLRTDQPAPVPSWQTAGDGRRAITIDQLLRMTSGLPFDETGGPVNPMTRMLFLERDMAAYAERVPLASTPGLRWGYSNLSYLVLSHLVRDAAGGGAAAERFVRRELFEPLHMRSALIECDAIGTPIGSGSVFASARDWARFGQLYLDDGIVDGQRILPEGWVRYSASQTLDTGYGAGFWTNLVNEGAVPNWDAPWGMPQVPKDMFYARGYLGQFIVIVPSERLVVVRLGLTHNAPTGVGSAVADIIAALHGK